MLIHIKMGCLDWIPFVQDAKYGLDHEKHQLKYHPDKERKTGFHMSNIKSLGQGFSSFADGFMGVSEMGHDDRVDAANQDTHGPWTEGQRKLGATTYHHVTYV